MAPASPAPDLEAAIPPGIRVLVDTLRERGFAAYAVGGGLRDALLDRPPADDWDLASSARPEEVLHVFPKAVYKNRFGTVGVPVAGFTGAVQITTFREDHDYADFRRPHSIVWGDRIETDLARRDFTMNALAWGGPADTTVAPALVDPYEGIADIERRVIRAVGDPAARFREDALRLLRAVRFATTLSFTIEPATLAAVRAEASLAAHLSGERVALELERLLGAARPSTGLQLLAETGILALVVPELDAQRGIPQNKVPGEDLWQHTLRTVDAAPAGVSDARLTALLHDLGKPSTFVDGRFMGHEVVGARMATALLDRLHVSRERTTRITHLIGHHMFSLEPFATGAAVRRFIARIGPDAVDDLLTLRAADNVGSGRPADAGRLDELRQRVDEQLAAQVALDRSRLAVDGHDLMTALGLRPGPRLGRLLEALTDRVIGEPALNERATLLRLARDLAATDDATSAAVARPEAAAPSEAAARHEAVARSEAAARHEAAG